MTIFGSIAKSLGGSVTSIAKVTPVSALPRPTAVVSPPRASVPTEAIPTKPVDITPTDAIPSTSISTPSSKIGTAVVGLGGVGLAGASIIPMLLNSSVVSGAIAGATQVGGIAVIADTVGEVATTLINSITDNPVNMSISAGAVVAVLYLLYR